MSISLSCLAELVSRKEEKAMYEKIKEYYERGLWNEERVRQAVTRNVITPEQFKEITGNDY